MLLNPITKTEYHDNGTLFFTTVTAEIVKGYEYLYDNNLQRRSQIDGKPVQPYIKLMCEKYYDNGQLAWRLVWDEEGNPTKDCSKHYRKDGTIIHY